MGRFRLLERNKFGFWCCEEGREGGKWNDVCRWGRWVFAFVFVAVGDRGGWWRTVWVMGKKSGAGENGVLHKLLKNKIDQLENGQRKNDEETRAGSFHLGFLFFFLPWKGLGFQTCWVAKDRLFGGGSNLMRLFYFGVYVFV